MVYIVVYGKKGVGFPDHYDFQKCNSLKDAEKFYCAEYKRSPLRMFIAKVVRDSQIDGQFIVDEETKGKSE